MMDRGLMHTMAAPEVTPGPLVLGERRRESRTMLVSIVRFIPARRDSPTIPSSLARGLP